MSDNIFLAVVAGQLVWTCFFFAIAHTVRQIRAYRMKRRLANLAKEVIEKAAASGPAPAAVVGPPPAFPEGHKHLTACSQCTLFAVVEGLHKVVADREALATAMTKVHTALSEFANIPVTIELDRAALESILRGPSAAPKMVVRIPEGGG